ncbi:hypothetical protein L210DRAFT_3614192 [Boletus edulis BED1]|uniref:Uncharacterized protein n=1 Tax=Boletus edulis BED1 TaxID=1328754 RepID=A0AAD4BL14_BOLED|nr:hypothetical protein L210DRAFT_3614192 [Boletus edulis BED1]
MVYIVLLIIFMNNVSGNISKQWNKHHMIYMLEQEFSIHFISSSPHATPMELMQGMKDLIQHICKEYSHGRLRCNYLCCTCKVGGINVEKKTDKGYISIFQCGELHMSEDIHAQVKHQIKLAKLFGGTEKVKDAISKTGIQDNVTAAIVDCLLALGKTEVTMHLNSELDALLRGQLDWTFTKILLNIVKYFWGQTTYILQKGQSFKTFQMRLESVNREGLNSLTLNADYIVRYKGGLVVRHFKTAPLVGQYMHYKQL